MTNGDFRQPDGYEDTAVLPVVSSAEAPADGARAPSGDHPAPRPRRARRVVIAVLTSVLVVTLLAAALVVADGLMRRKVQDALAGQLRGQLATPADPSVRMSGSPFALQLAEHRYRDVQIDAPGASIRDLSFPALSVHATDVRTRANNTEGTIGALQGSGTISYASLGAKAGVDMGYDSPGKLRIAYPGKVFGHQVTVIVVGRPELDAGAQNVSLRDLTSTVDGVNVPQFIVKQAASVLIKPVGIALPPGMKVTSIDPGSDGMHVAVDGSNVELSALH